MPSCSRAPLRSGESQIRTARLPGSPPSARERPLELPPRSRHRSPAWTPQLEPSGPPLADPSSRTAWSETTRDGRKAECREVCQSPASSCALLVFAIAPDQIVGRAVVIQLRLFLALEFRNDPFRQHLAELHSPLVERIDPPDCSLGEHRMLIKRHQLAESPRCKPLGENRIRRTVALENPVRDQPVGRAFRLDLIRRLAESQRLALRENVGHQNIVMLAQRIQRSAECDEVAGDQSGPLVNQLIKRMLAVGPRLAPVNRTRLIVNSGPIERDVLAVALHRQLL